MVRGPFYGPDRYSDRPLRLALLVLYGRSKITEGTNMPEGHV